MKKACFVLSIEFDLRIRMYCAWPGKFPTSCVLIVPMMFPVGEQCANRRFWCVIMWWPALDSIHFMFWTFCWMNFHIWYLHMLFDCYPISLVLYLVLDRSELMHLVTDNKNLHQLLLLIQIRKCLLRNGAYEFCSGLGNSSMQLLPICISKRCWTIQQINQFLLLTIVILLSYIVLLSNQMLSLQVHLKVSVSGMHNYHLLL